MTYSPTCVQQRQLETKKTRKLVMIGVVGSIVFHIVTLSIIGQIEKPLEQEDNNSIELIVIQKPEPKPPEIKPEKIIPKPQPQKVLTSNTLPRNNSPRIVNPINNDNNTFRNSFQSSPRAVNSNTETSVSRFSDDVAVSSGRISRSSTRVQGAVIESNNGGGNIDGLRNSLSPSTNNASVQVSINFTVAGSEFDRIARQKKEEQQRLANLTQEKERLARQQQLEKERLQRQQQLEKERKEREAKAQLEREKKNSN
jgi:hypothetical protein